MPECEPRNSFASNAFHFSIGSRRKSCPSSSSKSNAQRTALASAPWLQWESPKCATTAFGSQPMHVFNGRLVALGFYFKGILDFLFSPLFAFENSFSKRKCAAVTDHNAPFALTRHLAQLVSWGIQRN
jgi:hypothetical protein